MRYVIGTRGSKLALVQAEYVRDKLAAAYPEHEFEVRVIKTKGDMILNKPLHELGSKGVFVKEIETDILERKADIGVHSMKDMPSRPAPGLMFTKAWKREDPRDVLILREKKSLAELKEGAVIGTGSRRREFQLKRLRPDLNVVGIRGNVDSRLRKMEEQKLDGIVLAAAGLKRLGLEHRITQYLEGNEMIPAPAQGVLALEIREGDRELLDMLDSLCDEETVGTTEAERGFLREMGGDCHVPVGALCQKEEDGNYCLRAMFGNETGSKQAYTAVRGSDPAALVGEAAANIRRQMAGTVCLVGAGPGDPGLITVKGLEAVRKAGCIIYDRLSSPELLEEAGLKCEKIYVGKASHNHTMKQEEINALLVQKSMEYERVVRLKGGDVYVFGRGGEEGIYLKEHGVPFEVIPGVTSAIAGLAYGGIPVTHRGIAAGFHVVTAHNQKDELADIDFDAMARGKETCIFLMGLSKAEIIARRLMEAGMPAGTETAVISCATTLKQRVCVSDLEHIGERVKEDKLVSPAMIVVGKVVSLREKLNFFEEQPLFGRRYLIPKIGSNPTRLKELLEAKGAEADEIQVGDIVYTDRKFSREELQHVNWLIFTSKNGVEGFFAGMRESGLDIRALAGCKIAVIGKKTGEELEGHGLYADVMPKKYDSDALTEELKKQVKPEEMVWYLKGGNADDHLEQALKGMCRFTQIVVYENRGVEPEPGKLRAGQEYDGILFTCASSAGRFWGVVGERREGWKDVYSIGPKTTACLKKQGIGKVIEAEQPDYEGLVDAVINNRDCLLKRQNDF